MKAESPLRPQSRAWAARHPLAAISFMLGDKQPLQDLMIARSARFLLGAAADIRRWRAAMREIAAGDFVPMKSDGSSRPLYGNALSSTLGKWLYCAVRTTQPGVVIETGVASGVSSWVILNALHRNGRGRLYSVDLPNADTNRNYFVGTREPGWVVPDALRAHWDLRLGSARDLLPEILASAANVDVFFHDSDHSYEHMKFEFETVLPYMKTSGLIISDDVQKNEAFAEFTERAGLRSVVFTKGGCAIVAPEPGA